MFEGQDHLLLLKVRLQRDLGSALISPNIVKIAGRVGEKVLKLEGRESFESIFELLACYVLAIKLSHGLTDEPDSSIVKLIQHSHSISQQE